MKNIQHKLLISGIIVSLIFINFNLKAQNPGGVKSPVLWKKEWKFNAQKEKGFERFNYNPYMFFDEDRGYDQTKTKGVKNFSFFAVFSSHMNSDIMTFGNEENMVLVSNEAVFSRDKINYNSDYGIPRIMSFIENFEVNTFTNSGIDLLIGDKKIKDNWFEGGIGEIILFDRRISKEQRKRVETYLAIKYGISLSKDSDYISSSGEIVRHHNDHKEFNYDIIGIGRDDASALNQKQSTNVRSEIEFTLSMGLPQQTNKENERKMKNGSFIFCGHNNGKLIVQPNKDNDGILELDRQWKIISKNISGDNEIGLQLDVKKIKGFKYDLPFWLVLRDDKKEVEYIQMEYIDEHKLVATFKLNLDQKKSQYLGFIQASKIFARFQKDQEFCTEKGMTLHAEVGGILSEEVVIELTEQNSINNFEVNKLRNNTWRWDDLPYGSYNLNITDRDTSISKAIVHNIKDCPQINKTQILSPNPVQIGNEFKLDLSSFMEEVTISIYAENGRHVLSKQISKGVAEFNYSLFEEGVFFIHLNGDKVDETHQLVVIK